MCRQTLIWRVRKRLPAAQGRNRLFWLLEQGRKQQVLLSARGRNRQILLPVWSRQRIFPPSARFRNRRFPFSIQRRKVFRRRRMSPRDRHREMPRLYRAKRRSGSIPDTVPIMPPVSFRQVFFRIHFFQGRQPVLWTDHAKYSAIPSSYITSTDRMEKNKNSFTFPKIITE